MTTRIKAKFLKAGCPCKVIENTINNFNNVDEELMIPRWFFDERKTVVINFPFPKKNEHFSKTFCKKLKYNSNGEIKFNIIWVTKKIKSLFAMLSCSRFIKKFSRFITNSSNHRKV